MLRHDGAFVAHAPLARAPSRRARRTICAPRMLEQNTVLAVGAALLGIGGGIGLVAFTERQGQRTEKRENTRPCVECKGETRVTCNVCNGSGKDPLGDKDPTRNGPCSYCEGAKTIKCFNCAGTGVQPRFLDRCVLSRFLISQFESGTSASDLLLLVTNDYVLQMQSLRKRLSPEDFMD